MRYVFDVETNGLLNSLSKIHCLVLINIDTEKVFVKRKDFLTDFCVICTSYIMTNWIHNYVIDLPLQPNGSMRLDCPVCSRKNTFSVTEKNGQRLYNCFHVDCKARGRTDLRLTKDNAHESFLPRRVKAVDQSLVFEEPDTFVPISRSEEAISYIKSVHALNSFREGRVDLRFDFKRNRVVYLIFDGHRIVDAVGRNLTNEKPKWWRYGKSGYPFVCGDGHVGIIVEDCASACSVSNNFTGIALLGTSLLDSYIPILRKYKRLYVALDKDATKKALEIVIKLQDVVTTKMMILNQDLKDMRDETRERVLAGYD